jgi:long-chain fatty acid transport protein
MGLLMRMGAGNAVVWAGVALGVLSAVGEARAGGFAVHEQSAYGQGASFAGIAAGGALSGMFWNPAVMTQFGGLSVETSAAGILPYAKQSPGAGSTLLPLGGVNNSGEDALVPSMYGSWQVAANVWVGMSITSPFGLSVNFPDVWAGRNYAQNTTLRTYNATPSVAVRVNEWLSIGAGIQIMYAKADLYSGLTFGAPFGATHLNINGDGWGFGGMVGLTVTPAPGTVIGLGWRSAVDLDIDGVLGLSAPLPLSTPGAVSTTLKLPDIVTLSARHQVNPALTLLGTVEWSNWSRIGTSNVNATVLGTPVALPFQYSDGWFFAFGAEYAYTPNTTLRAGFAYEISPITDRVRTPRLPDNDRFWLSVGLSQRLPGNFLLDVAYSHLFVDNTSINIAPGSGNPWFNGVVSYVGTVDAHVDIISIGLRYQFNAPPAAPVLFTKG